MGGVRRSARRFEDFFEFRLRFAFSNTFSEMEKQFFQLAFAVVLLFMTATSTAQDFSGVFQGTEPTEGRPVRVEIVQSGSNFRGVLQEQGTPNPMLLEGSISGKSLKGTATETTFGVTMNLTGSLGGSQLNLQLSMENPFGGEPIAILLQLERSTTPSGTADTAPAAQSLSNPTPGKEHDPALVGAWFREQNYNSGYGDNFGFMSSRSGLIFYADGSLADGGNQTQVGGSTWSGQSGGTGQGTVPGVFWYTQGQRIYLQGEVNGQNFDAPIGKYYIEDGKMLLTTDSGEKQLFFKQ
jgi:hypothetical protein